MELVVKVVGKDIKNGNSEFTSYSVLTAELNWYRTAGLDVKELAKFDGMIAKIKIIRKYDKKFTTKDGKEGSMPVLVIESITEPTIDEVRAYEDRQRELYAETLDGIN